MNMILFPNDQDKQEKQDNQPVPSTAKEAEEASRITARELEDYFKRGKELIEEIQEKKDR